MNSILKKRGDFIAQNKFERLQAENEALKASLDYVAMMADVELPESENDMEDSNAQPEIR